MESKFRAKYPLSSDIPLKKYFGWKIHLNLQEEWTKKLARYYLIVISLLDCDFDGWLVDEGSSSNRTRTTTPTTPTRRSWPTRCCRRPAPTRRRRTSSPSTRRRTASSWATRRRRSSSSTSTARAWRSAALWSAGSIAGAFHSTTGRNPIGSSHTVAIMPFACEVHLFFFRNQLVVGRDPFDGAKAAELAGAWSTKVTPKWPTVVFLSRSSRSPWGHDPSDTTTTPGGVVTHQIGASAELDSTDCRTRLQKRKTKKTMKNCSFPLVYWPLVWVPKLGTRPPPVGCLLSASYHPLPFIFLSTVLDAVTTQRGVPRVSFLGCFSSFFLPSAVVRGNDSFTTACHWKARCWMCNRIQCSVNVIKTKCGCGGLGVFIRKQ